MSNDDYDSHIVCAVGVSSIVQQQTCHLNISNSAGLHEGSELNLNIDT